MKLVVIEGPGKRETLKKYLGEGYDVMATKGHIRDLPIKETGIDFEHNFEPKYVAMPDKKEIIEDLKKRAAKAEKVLLATDPDREGEAIAWHIAHILGFKPEDKCRIEFNEISHDVVQNAVKQPRIIDQKLVDAQQARRVLDRIVGYKLSPILCKKIKSKLSAGRVQSVALEIVVDREEEISNFVPKEYWNVFANLKKLDDDIIFRAQLDKKSGKKIKPASKEEVDAILSAINGKNFVVDSVKKSQVKSHPNAPFTTSTMQQDAGNKLGYDLARTSKVAQVLYEGVELPGEGKVALITYIRTDSTRVSKEAQDKALDFIGKNFGKDFVPEKPNFFASKENAQDAHEAIRPINLARTPESLQGKIPTDAYRLYKLIFDRFLASQMSDAIYNNLTVDIKVDDYSFKCGGKTLVFAGFTAVYKNYEEASAEDSDNDANAKLPALANSDILENKEIKFEQKFTLPPKRYTEQSLVKAMEEKGIGRPATYAPTITTLSSRDYTQKEGRYLVPTELGKTVVKYLKENFDSIMNIEFTAQMESTLDGISEGGKDWQEVIAKFWHHFAPFLKRADENSVKVKVPAIVTEVVCDKCGSKMVIREGKYGKFLGCSNFPKCKNIMKMPSESAGTEEGANENSQPKTFGKCPKCGKDIVMKRTKAGKSFYGCSGYPTCDFASWNKPKLK